MKIHERYLWIGAIILAGFVAQNQSAQNGNLRTLITTYDLETNIQDAQITDVAQQLYEAKQLEYDKGFEEGRTQAAIVLMDKGSLYNYTDGYHAAVGQFGLTDGADPSSLSRGVLLDMLLLTLNKEEDAQYIQTLTSLRSNREGISAEN